MDAEIQQEASELLNENNGRVTDNQQTETPSELEITLKKREQFDDAGLLPIVTSICCGVLFGIFFNKSRVFEPHVIYNQMILKQFILLKIFLSAAGTSCFSAVFVGSFYPEYLSIARSSKAAVDTKNIYRVIIGSIALGAGMTVSGSCPGNLPVQLGAGVENSIFTLIGAIGAAIIYGFTDLLREKILTNPNIKHANVDEYMSKISVKWLCVVFGIICWIITIAFEVIFPWKSELNTPLSPDCNFLTCSSWPPSVCGLFVGLLQIPCMLVFGSYIGMSSVYAFVVPNWMKCDKELKSDPYDKPSWWRFVFYVFTIVGSWFGVALNSDINQSHLNIIKYPYDNINGMNMIRSLIGGCLIIYGARLSRGCTSGHGFSGSMLMSTSSLIAICGMFGAAIITGFLIEYLSK
eukprot:548505_1